MIKKGDKIDVEIIRVNEEGKGVAFTDDGFILLIDNVDETDRMIKVEIINVFEESGFAKRISKSKTTTKNTEEEGYDESPYDLDDGDEEEDY